MAASRARTVRCSSSSTLANLRTARDSAKAAMAVSIVVAEAITTTSAAEEEARAAVAEAITRITEAATTRTRAITADAVATTSSSSSPEATTRWAPACSSRRPTWVSKCRIPPSS